MNGADLDPPIAVGGGAAGHAALTEDLDRAAGALALAAADVAQVARQLRLAQWAGQDATADALPAVRYPLGLAVARVEDARDGPRGALALAREIDDAGVRLAQVARAYEEAEAAAQHRVGLIERAGRGARDLAGTGVWLGRAVVGGAWRFLGAGVPLHALGADPVGDAVLPDGHPPTTGYLNADTVEFAARAMDLPRGLMPSPYTVAVAVAVAAGRSLETLVGEPEYVGAAQRAAVAEREAPPGIAALVEGVDDVRFGTDGAVAIDTVVGEHGSVSYVVSIPGTADHTPWDPSTFDWTSNGEAVLPTVSDTARLVRDAMALAGIPEDAPVMLVGHSQGGIVAAELPASGLLDAYHVTHVVTLGAPADRSRKLPDIDYLHVTSEQEIVNGLDARPTADAPHVTEVVADLRAAGDPALVTAGTTLLGAHLLPTYAAIGRSADASTSGSMRAWRSSARPFLSGTSATRREYVPGFSPGARPPGHP